MGPTVLLGTSATITNVLRKQSAKMMLSATRDLPEHATLITLPTHSACTARVESAYQAVLTIPTVQVDSIARITSVQLLLARFLLTPSQSKLAPVMDAPLKVLLRF